MTNIASRPVRSFKPTTLKAVKQLSFRVPGAKYIGETEPIWPDAKIQKAWTRRDYETRMVEALNWYSKTQTDNKTPTDCAFTALSLSGHFPELVVALKNSTTTMPKTTAWLLRMAHNGMILRFKEKKFIVRDIRSMLDTQKEIVETVDATPKPTIQDHIKTKLHRVMGEIDFVFDEFIRNNYEVPKTARTVADILADPKLSPPGNRVKDLIDYCQKYIAEYNDALSGKVPDLTEAYALVGRRRIKYAIEWFETAIAALTSYGQQKQSLRKTRTRKVKTPSQLVNKLRFLREFPDLNLTSIDPAQILKCSELWVYNTRMRKLGRYVALNGTTFEVKGTRLVNLDTVKSVQKTIRKPAEQLKEFGNYSKPGAVKWFNNIRAVATPMRDAINKDSILLKGIK
jgi:hypothetical protein